MIYRNLPILETKRLVLRPITMHDIPAIFNYSRDPEVSKLLLWHPPQSIEDTQKVVERWIAQYHANEEAPWGIVDKETGLVIGTLDIRDYDVVSRSAAIGYCLSRAHWGKGLMVEAVRCIIEHFFSHTPITTLVAFVRIDNPQSQRVLEKVGMTLEQPRAKREYIKDAWVELDRWVIYK